jgi:predicted O-methyltransferase YrrM
MKPLYESSGRPNGGKPLQAEAEIAAFCDLLAREGVKSYLEIGSKFGGSLWRVANALPKGSRIVSIDLNRNGTSLQECINALNGSGYDAWLIPFDSTLPEAIERAKGLGPYDALFIDGDHRADGVWADWHNYSAMARIVGFHDIGWKRSPDNPKAKSIAVPEIWDEIKQGHRFEEIKLDKSGKNNGIGVLWRQ